MNKELLSQIEELSDELLTLKDLIDGSKNGKLSFLLMSQLAVDLNKTLTRLRKHRELLAGADGE